jgi:amino acid permease
MKNAIIGTFFVVLSFLLGCYVGYETSEEQTIEYDGISLTRYEIQRMMENLEEEEQSKKMERKDRLKSKRAAQEKRKLRQEIRQV